jgi:hypothetical protein
MQPEFYDVTGSFVRDGDNLVYARSQEIPHEFLDGLRDERLASSHVREREFMKVASLPVSLVELWLAQGFNVYRESPRAIVARLKAHDLGAFLATSKTV